MKNKISEKLQDLVYFLQDGIAELKIRRRKAENQRERMRASLSPEEFKKYLKKEQLRMAAYLAGGIAVLLLVIFLMIGLFWMIGKAVSSISFAKRTSEEVMAPSETEKLFPEKTITIGSTGCMLLHSPFIDSYPDEEGNYDFSSIYRFITPYYSAPDFMTCEFEGALGGAELGYSGYPSFRSPDVIIENIRDSGVDLQLLATNHIYDAWAEGFHRTSEVYEEKGIAYTGIRRTEEDCPYYIADIQGVKIGFVNYVYETTSQTAAEGYGNAKSLNGMILEEEDAPLVNSFDYEKLDSFYSEMKEHIKKMKNEGVQFIIANLHWGTEYQLQESDVQREIAQKLCDLGVDALIGGHPHCEQPIDDFTSSMDSHHMFCIFSEGNALSNQRTYLLQEEMPEGHTEDGVMVTLTLHQNSSGKVSIVDVELLPTWVYRYQDDGSKYYILPLDDVENLESATGITGIREEALASYTRTMEELGPGLEKVKKIYQA